MSIRGIPFKFFALAMGVIAILIGAYVTFFQSRGFEKTTATIVSIEEDERTFENEDATYTVTAEYDVDGTRYTGTLDSYSPSYAVGKTVTVRYDPNDPTVIHSGGGIGLYALIVGVVIVAVILVTGVKNKKSQEDMRALRESRGQAGYAPSEPGTERELYFLTDLGTPKYGHRIEDGSRRVLYEAKMTKFSLTAPFGFDFIDHEHGATVPHLVGHEETTQWDTLLIDNHYTFTFDGEDIWKHLRRNGVTVDSRYDSGDGRLIGTSYRIIRDGVEIARAESTSQYPHEDDAAAHKVAGAVPARGFYRVWTTERNLDLLFVTLLAFARSGASDDRGGHYGALFGTLGKSGK